MRKEKSNIEFIGSLDFDFIENLPNSGTDYLLIFYESPDEISRSKQFGKTAITGRHQKLRFIYMKHNLFHKSANRRDTELQNTHIVLFRSPRDVQQIDVLGKKLCLENTIRTWYADATSTPFAPFGLLMVEISRKANDLLRYCTDVTSFASKFYLPSSRFKITQINDEKFGLLYSKALSNFQQRLSENFLQSLFQTFD